jgi:branched-chain amino acid transport system permease protein
MKTRKDLTLLLVLYGIVAVLPVFVDSSAHMMNILLLCMIWSVVAASWNLIMGFAGIFTFGQVAFYVIGAYCSAIISIKFGITPWLSIFIAGIFTAFCGAIVALPCLKLKGSYVALVTFAVHMILEPFLKSNAGRAIGTGGPQGILTIPPLKLFGYIYDIDELIPWFYTVLILTFIIMIIFYKIIHSNWGLAFLALNDSETFAKSVGVNDFKFKLLVFSISSFFTGLIGGVYAHYIGMLSPRLLGLDLFLILMVMLLFGGIGKFPGAVYGAFIAVLISEWLRPLENYRQLIFGAIVILLVIFMPRGIAGLALTQEKNGRGKSSKTSAGG